MFCKKCCSVFDVEIPTNTHRKGSYVARAVIIAIITKIKAAFDATGNTFDENILAY